MATSTTSSLLSTQAISLGRDVFQQFDKWLEKRTFSKVFFLVDENTHEHCLPDLLASLANLNDFEILEVEAGEESKSPEVLLHLYHALTELQADRQSLLINVGGGVVCDLGGFLAATYMRGIPFINFPTSLLAMVDASVGGKTGIDLGGHKNQIGLFARAEQVYVYPEFLESLPEAHVLAGYAEMLKHGLIADEKYFHSLVEHIKTEQLPSEVQIEQSIAIKTSVVEADFRESGLRKKLNFGHSLGHAIEGACLEQQIPMLHGQAVAFGMMGELWLSKNKQGLAEEAFTQAYTALQELYGIFQLELDQAQLLHLLKGDKKNTSGKLQFVLLSRLGEAAVDVEVSTEEALEALAFILKH